jgi:hypothetical protein
VAQQFIIDRPPQFGIAGRPTEVRDALFSLRRSKVTGYGECRHQLGRGDWELARIRGTRARGSGPAKNHGPTVTRLPTRPTARWGLDRLAKGVSQRRDRPAAMIAIAAFFTALLIESAQIFDLVFPHISRRCFFVMLIIVAYYLRPPWKKADLPMVLAGMGALVFVIIEHAIFVLSTGWQSNFSAVASFLPLIGFVPVYRSQCSLATTLRIFLALMIIYLFIYVVGFQFFTTTDFGITRIIHNDSGRGLRLFLMASFASYVAFYSMSDTKLHFAARIALIFVALIALYLSGYRTFMICFLLVAGLSVARLTGLATRLVLFAVVVIVSAVLLWGIVFPGWNPFVYFGSDNSASARADEYSLAQYVLTKHWFLGIGIASDFQAQQTFVGSPTYKPLYPSDLGSVGALLMFGIPGFIAFIAMTFFSMMAPIQERGTPELRALRLNGIVCGVIGVISPSIILEANAIFFALIFAAWLRDLSDGGPGVAKFLQQHGSRWREPSVLTSSIDNPFPMHSGVSAA